MCSLAISHNEGIVNRQVENPVEHLYEIIRNKQG